MVRYMNEGNKPKTINEKELEILEFWNKNKNISLNKRQIDVLNRFIDDFKGNLTTTKWSKMCNCSQDTATRDIVDLIEKGILTKQGEARATHYTIKFS